MNETAFDKLWGAFVMLKRSMDQHETKPDKMELLKSDWEAAVSTAIDARQELGLP